MTSLLTPVSVILSISVLAAPSAPLRCTFPEGRRVFSPDEGIVFHVQPAGRFPALRVLDFNDESSNVRFEGVGRNMHVVVGKRPPGIYWIVEGKKVIDAFVVFAPAPASTHPERTRFGVFHAYTNDNYAHYNVRRELDMLREAHLYWVRATTFMTPYLHSGSDWRARDQFIDDLRDRGLVLLSMFEEMNFPKAWKPLLTNPKTLKAIADYVAHTKGRLRYFEVWNEVNNERSGTLEQYLKFQRKFYDMVRRINPEARVVETGLASPKFRGQWGAFLGPKYQDGLLAGGMDAWTDVYNFHYYPYQWKTRDFLDQYMDVFHRYHARKPIWVTENGMSADFADISAQKEQATYLVRSAVTCLATGIKRYFWFLSRDHRAFAYGLLTADLKPKAAYAAYGVLARTLGDSRYIGEGPHDHGTVEYRFRAGAREVRVLWANDTAAADSPAVPVPRGAFVGDIMGRKIPLGPGGAVRVGPVPVFIVVQHTPSAPETE